MTPKTRTITTIEAARSYGHWLQTNEMSQSSNNHVLQRTEVRVTSVTAKKSFSYNWSLIVSNDHDLLDAWQLQTHKLLNLEQEEEVVIVVIDAGQG